MVQACVTTPGLIKHDKKHRLKQRFEVKHKLGQGTYGKVQLAINKETGQEVAIKTIKKSKIQNEQDLVRIRREIQIMSSIQHPHIIHIYEVFENKEKIVLVMQYASGGELYEYVSDRKVLSDNEARRLFRQIATAVYYCHKNKVCHRDLKLENILLDHNGNAKIADFGLSNVFDERHFLNTFCGSPLYASPEIVKGIPYYGAEVDCWSLGVLLYTLVYGAMPFDGSNFKRLVKQISESSYYEPKQKSEASGLIKRLLAVDPTKRATIIDICTDWWVNKGYEHSLLQVAEDLANLTPVRLDVLLALAPISPPVEGGNSQPPLTGREAELLPGAGGKTKRSKSKSSRSDEALYPASTGAAAIDYQADTSELSTDIPTYAEEEEEQLASEIIDDGDEFLPSALAAALQDECQETVKSSEDITGATVVGDQGLPVAGTSTGNSAEPGKSTKRIAGSSFDSNSVSRVSSNLMKRKKPKKGSEEMVTTESEDRPVSSSGYMSDGTSITGGTFPPSQIVTDDLTHRTLVTEDNESVNRTLIEGERVEDDDDNDTTMLNKTSTVPYDSLPDENVSISSQISSLPETGRDSRSAKGECSLSGTITSKTQSSASIETLTAKDSQETPSKCEMTSSSSTLIDDKQKSTSSVKSKSKSTSPKRPMPSKTSSSSFTSTSSSSTIISGKQHQPSSSTTVSSGSSNSSRSVSDKRVKPGDKPNTNNRNKSAKDSPPKSLVKGKVEETMSTLPSSTSTSTITTTETSSTLKESPTTSAPESEASESVPTTPDADNKTKPWIERRASVDRKVGKISYPKFLENKSAPEKKPVPTYGKISTAKKMFESRRSSVDKDKERVIPMVKVSDAKRAFERRASMPATQALLWKNAGERKGSLMQQSSLDETIPINSERSNQPSLSKDKSSSMENTTTKQSASHRPRKSPHSSPVKSRSPNKSPVKTLTSKQSSETKPDQLNKSIELKQSEMVKDSAIVSKPKVKSTNSIVINSGTKKIGTSEQSTPESKQSIKMETNSVDNQSSESRSNTGVKGGTGESVSRLIESPSILDSPCNEEEKKSLAKDVIKKQIAKAKLQELRQSSIESHESNLSVSSDQHGTKLTCQTGSSSDELNSKPKSYVKAPQPFIKEEIKPTPIRSVAEIKLSSKPKLGLDIEAAHRGQPKQYQKQQSDEIEEITPTNIIEPPSTAGTTQNQESNPGTPSTAATTTTANTLSKAAPITRSYKKVTFTKDGACITETGKIISEESADGSFSRIEKKSKVTHYPGGSGSGASTNRSESSEETRTIKNLGGSVRSGVGDESFDESRNGSISPPPIAPSMSGLRRSESASSSGSTDIFDDIFDTWSGDPVFGNISGRMRSMLSSSRSPFTSLWGTAGRNKKSKKKSRAESAERKPTLASGSGWRRAAGHGTDQELSDTDTDTEPSIGIGSAGTGGGLWKFLGTTPTSSNLMDRHRSLLSRHFGSDDFFSDAEPFGSSFRRSLSRDRGSTTFGTTRNSSAAGTPTMRMVINPLRTPRSSVNRMTGTPAKQDSLDSNESGGSNTQQHVPTSFSSQPFTGRPYSRTISRESQRQREGVGGTEEKSNVGGGGSSFDLDDGSSIGPSSRRRVEQWLDMGRDDEEIGSNHPISMYTTIRPRPRPINRYGRSVSSRFGFDLGSVDSPRDNFQGPSGGSNLSFNTTQEIQIGSPSVGHPETTPRTVGSKPRAEVIIPVGRSNVTSPSMVGGGVGNTSSQGKPMITMKLSLGGGNEPREVRTFISSGSGGGLGGGGLIGSTTGIVETPGSADSFGDDWSNPILLPESSSLLDQLRTHGYRNLVTQRLSGISGPSVIGGEGATRYDNRDNSCVSTSTTTTTTSTTTTPTTNTTVNLPPQQMKRGKSLSGDSSSIRNLENLIVKNGQSYNAWSNPVNGQSSTIIKSTNNNRMPNQSMDQLNTTNPNRENITVNHNDNEKKLISSNRVVRVVKQPVVGDQSVGVNCSSNQTNRIEINHQNNNQNYESIKFIDDGEGNGDDVGSTKSTPNYKPIVKTGKLINDDDDDEKSINNKTNLKINSDAKSGNNQKETATINIPINRISTSNNNGNQVTSYFSSSITKVTSSLPPKPKPFNLKHEKDDKLLTVNEDNQSNHHHQQLHHHHHHPNLNQVDQVPPFHLHQQSTQSSGEGEYKKPSTPIPPPTTTTFNRELNQTQQQQHQQQQNPVKVQQNQPHHRKQQFNDIKTSNNNHLPSKDANDDTINRKNVNNNDDNSHRSLNHSTSYTTTTTNTPTINSTFNDPHHKETLQERILRKSYYSRFNHPLERRASSVRRRTSMIENGDRLLDFSLFDNISRNHYHPSSTPVTPSAAAAASSSHQSPFDNHHHHTYSSNHHLKPPLYLTNDQFIERVQIRAQQLIEEARERHSRINSQLMSSFRPFTLDLNDDLIGHHHLRNHSSPHSSHLSSHSTSSSHRSREPSPSTFLRRTSSFSDSDEFHLNNKFRRPSSSSSTTTATTPTTSTTDRSSAVGTLFNGSKNTPTSTRSSANSYKSARTCSTRLTNGHSQELDDDEDDYDYGSNSIRNNGDTDGDYLGDDLTSRAQVVSEALQKLKERALREN